MYEDHEFFDYCDAHGLMVWQDFMFACEFAPRDAWFQDVVFEETVKGHQKTAQPLFPGRVVRRQ